MTRIPFLSLAMIALLAAWGCDGDSMGELDGGGGTDSGVAMDGGGADSGDVDGGAGDDAGPGDDASPSGDASPGDDGGTSGDGGGGTTDAGPPAVACGTMTCSGLTPQCCVVTGGGGAMSTCISADERCRGVTASCDGPEDCPGTQQCCVGLGSAGSGGASCQDACGIGARAACHDATTCPSVDGRALMCCPFMGGGFTGSVCLAMCLGTGTP